jgi:large subunit ribosomal protein L22
MEVSATAKYVRVQPRKVRIVADEIRGKKAEHSAALLRFHPSKGAKALRKVLMSAMANAKENHDLSPGDLTIATIMVDQGPTMKRMQARAMGRGNRIMKKTSHITVVVEDHERTPSVRPHGTKAKARPTFAAPAAKGKKKGGPAKVSKVEEEAPIEETPVAEAVEAAPVETSEAPVVEAPAIEEATETTSEETPDAGSDEATASEEVAADTKEAE